MNTRLGAINVPPATLFVIPTVFQLVVLVVYDRFIIPFLRKKTGYVGGVTLLQRIGISFTAAIMASGVAAIVEMKRKSVAEQSGLMDSPTPVLLRMILACVSVLLHWGCGCYFFCRSTQVLL